ncbi:MAG TPA: DoxX family protein [Myxococcaceae bacterium]|nr:DoxX family protein [Myxococcaceae bacterium]
MQFALLVLLAGLMMFAGVMHFVTPAVFVRIVPRWLPAPAALVSISGACEILCGVGLLVPLTRRLAAWGLIALLIAVFPANVNMALNHLPFGRQPVPTWALWARLPLQAVLIAWAWSFTRDSW